MNYDRHYPINRQPVPPLDRLRQHLLLSYRITIILCSHFTMTAVSLLHVKILQLIRAHEIIILYINR